MASLKVNVSYNPLPANRFRQQIAGQNLKNTCYSATVFSNR